MKKQFDMQGWLYKQWKKSNGLTEEKQPLKEEYVESMDIPNLLKHMQKIEKHWKDWKKGPMTERSDIKPAAKELKDYLRSWFSDKIK